MVPNRLMRNVTGPGFVPQRNKKLKVVEATRSPHVISATIHEPICLPIEVEAGLEKKRGVDLVLGFPVGPMFLRLAHAIDGRDDGWGVRSGDYLNVGTVLIIQIILH
jgi:hypothetical protein